MAEKSSELIINQSEGEGVLSKTDKDAISAVAGAYEDDSFVEKYTDELNPAARREIRETATEADEATEETEHLKAQIEETRNQMGETIDAIQERLSLQNISEQVREQVSEQISNALETAKDTVYDATIRKAGRFMNRMNKTINEGLEGISNSGAAQFARENPLALSLIGLGVGMLLMNGYRSSRRYTDGSSHDYPKGAFAAGGELYSNRASMLKSAPSAIAETASGAYDTVTHAAGSAYDRVTHAASSAASGVSHAASNVYDTVTHAAEVAYEKAGEIGSQARERYDHYIEENPLAVGAVALALGAAVGMALPTTRVENRLMGETKKNLLDLAQHKAEDLVDRVKQVANEAQKTIGDEVKAQTQDLTQ